MKLGDLVMVTVPGAPGEGRGQYAAIVVGTGSAKLGDEVTPTASVRVFTKATDFPFAENVPVYDSEAAATADGAGKWHAFTCYPIAAAGAVSAAGDTPAVPAEVPAAPVPTFTSSS